MKLIIERQPSEKKQTLGAATILNAKGEKIYSCKTLELPWLDNQTQKSCIPAGSYQVVKRWSEKYGNHFHVLNVPGRSYILIHVGNYYKEILGCILVGQAHQDINKDGIRDVTSSKVTMAKLKELLPKSFTLEIC